MLKTLLGWGSWIRWLLAYLIAPPVCYVCHTFLQERTVLCQSCDELIISIAPKLIKINSSYMMKVHAICKYDNNPVKGLILAKHRSDHVMIQGLAKLMWEKTIVSHLQIDCFIPIPLHWTRRFKRGFNQADMIAKYLSKQKNIQVCNILKRVKRTQYQARLEQNQRNTNVKGAFVVKKRKVDLQGKHVMLVDDLCTTGSTAIEAAKVIAKYKPASISLIVASRA